MKTILITLLFAIATLSGFSQEKARKDSKTDKGVQVTPEITLNELFGLKADYTVVKYSMELHTKGSDEVVKWRPGSFETSLLYTTLKERMTGSKSVLVVENLEYKTPNSDRVYKTESMKIPIYK